VDDHAEFRRLARRLLESSGYDVVGEAGSCAEALEAVQRTLPDVVLLDVLLPDGNGFDVAETLAALTPAPVVVLVSSRGRADLGPRVETTSARGFLTKADLNVNSFAALAP
jgi:two-component system nitrate/nitrite response regulator NarL